MAVTVAEFFNKVGFKVDQESVNKVNGTIKDIKSTATKLLGAIGIGLSLSAINGLVEEFGAANKHWLHRLVQEFDSCFHCSL